MELFACCTVTSAIWCTSAKPAQSRPIGERIKEHEREVRLGHVDGSAVAEHAFEAGHHPNWDNVQGLNWEQH